MATNTFTPLQATANPNGRSQFSTLLVDQVSTSAQNFSTQLRNRAYARMDASTINLSNPDFDSGAAGRLIGSLTEGNRGRVPQISRGYIRRSVLDNGDPTSQYRLYFMYNPSTIQRSFVSYLDQEALDPFNTVFGSNNLVAPPGVLDFQFTLFFDRQAENASGTMPRGVLEDFDFFDLVVRGVVPDGQSSALPDNGIMMINPRNINVIFSPQLSVQGRPNSASVTYTKFDHRMRPIRMEISIGMKAVYLGPVRADFTFAQSKVQGDVSATVPYENSSVSVTAEKASYIKAKVSTPKSSFASAAVSSGVAAAGGVATGNTAKYPINQGYTWSGGGGHPGIDFGAPTGTPALAPVPLVIAHAGPERSTLDLTGFGTSVAGVDFGSNLLIFGHLGQVAVNVGQVVQPGQILGYTDSTGWSSGPHLHFEIRAGVGTSEGSSAASIDPMPFITGGWQVLG